MSSLAQTINIQTTRLEKGEVVVLDNIPKEIVGVEKLYHYVVYTAAELTAGVNNLQKNIRNLQPEQNELYQIDNIGIDGAGQVRIEYPLGATRTTPHQLAEVYDQVVAPVGGHAFGLGLVYFWCVPERYPVLRVSNPLAVAVITVIYFHGWKYRVRMITAQEVEAKRAMGVRVLEAESYYPTS